MKLFSFGKKTLWLLLFSVLLHCSPLPDIVSREKKDGETYSADDVRRMTVDQPFQLSGDYFRERDQQPSRNLNKLFSKEKDQKAEIETVPKQSEADNHSRIAAAPVQNPTVSEVPLPETGVRENNFPVKTALVLDKENIPQDTAERIMQALPQAAENLPILSADREKVEEVMARTDCPQRDLQCLSAALSVYPGVRMLILIENFDLPKEKSAPILAKIGLVDTGILFRYPTMEIRIPDNERAINAVLRQVLTFAVKKSEIMPWFCRPFSSDKGEWYISAGNRSGLKPGQELAVISPGKVIQSPIGLPAGWVPGEKRGMLKVKQLFGEDFAICTLESGKEPNPEDLLMLP